MKKTLLSLIILMTTSLLTQGDLLAQNLGLKLNYGFTAVDELPRSTDDITTEMLRKCDLGLVCRYGEKHLFLQAEAYFSINSVWEEVAVARDFGDKVSKAFSTIQSTNLSIPLMMGWRFFKKGLVNPHVAFGWEFYTKLNNFRFKNLVYSMTAEAGVDLGEHISVDLRLVSPFDVSPEVYHYNKGMQIAVCLYF